MHITVYRATNSHAFGVRHMRKGRPSLSILCLSLMHGITPSSEVGSPVYTINVDFLVEKGGLNWYLHAVCKKGQFQNSEQACVPDPEVICSDMTWQLGYAPAYFLPHFVQFGNLLALDLGSTSNFQNMGHIHHEKLVNCAYEFSRPTHLGQVDGVMLLLFHSFYSKP